MKKLVMLACLAASPVAHAQSDRGMYFGAGLGWFDYEESDEPGSPGVSDSTYAYHLFGGYKFTENFALEFGIGGSGDIEQDIVQNIPGLGPITLELDGNYDIYRLDAIGLLPLDRFSLFAGVGYFSANLSGDVNAVGFGTVGSLDGSENGASVKLGVQRDFGLDLKSLSIRGHYDWYDFGDGIDASGFTIALLFRF
jgi:hypothetical protein